MPRWTRLGFDRRLKRSWADGTVLFNALSGETHVLNPLANGTLELIDRAPATESELLDALLQSDAHLDRDALAAELDELLNEMARLGLIAAEP